MQWSHDASCSSHLHGNDSGMRLGEYYVSLFLWAQRWVLLLCGGHKGAVSCGSQRGYYLEGSEVALGLYGGTNLTLSPCQGALSN